MRANVVNNDRDVRRMLLCSRLRYNNYIYMYIRALHMFRVQSESIRVTLSSLPSEIDSSMDDRV